MKETDRNVMKNPPLNDNSNIEASIEVEYRIYRINSRVSNDYSEPTDFILEVEAKIIADAEFSEISVLNHRQQVGALKFYLIRIGAAMDAGCSIPTLMDGYQETLDAGYALFNDRFNDFSSSVKSQFEEACFSDDILLFEKLTIVPCARGQRIGAAVLHRAMLDFAAGCSLVVLKPYPLQFAAGIKDRACWKFLELDKFSSSKKNAFAHLAAYYQRLGFERIGRSQYYALCTANRLPSPEDLSIPDDIRLPASHFSLTNIPDLLGERHDDE